MVLPIYTITTIPYDFPQRDARTIAWYESAHAAVAEVKNNGGDMYEDGHYRFVVVEQVPEGMYMVPPEEFWFEWSQDRLLVGKHIPGYIKLDKKPNRFNNIACWAIG